MNHRSYIGPERRETERRSSNERRSEANAPRSEMTPQRRDWSKPERRRGDRRVQQQALTGIIVGLTAEQMQELAAIWHECETGKPTTGATAVDPEVMARYREIGERG